MVTEIALIDTLPERADAFAAAYREAHAVLAGTPGCLDARMMRSTESPTRFVGIVQWESRRHHLENFRGTERYDRYRALLAPCLAAPPVVEHFDPVAPS